MAFPALMAISDLYNAVEVGFVEGISPAITPTGTAMVRILCSSSRLSSPMVFISLMCWYTPSLANTFLITLSASTPNPVSSCASFARRCAFLTPACATDFTILSTSAWLFAASSCCADLAFSTSSRTSCTDKRSLSYKCIIYLFSPVIFRIASISSCFLAKRISCGVRPVSFSFRARVLSLATVIFPISSLV